MEKSDILWSVLLFHSSPSPYRQVKIVNAAAEAYVKDSVSTTSVAAGCLFLMGWEVLSSHGNHHQRNRSKKWRRNWIHFSKKSHYTTRKVDLCVYRKLYLHMNPFRIRGIFRSSRDGRVLNPHVLNPYVKSCKYKPNICGAHMCIYLYLYLYLYLHL